MSLPPEIIEKIPDIKAWIADLLRSSSGHSRSTSVCGFTKLPKYFSESLLKSAKVVETKQLPMLPVAQLGLTHPGLRSFERADYAAITYVDTYFITPAFLKNEATHFHELIHVIQWRYLGPERFLVAYGEGLLSKGYWDSPFEVMARRHEEKFSRGIVYPVEAEVLSELKAMEI